MTECTALLRGINVGRAKRIAMAQLRDGPQTACRIEYGSLDAVARPPRRAAVREAGRGLSAASSIATP
jgi:hypothetical protein